MERDHAPDPATGHALLQSRALAVPSRARILEVLRASPRPMTAADVAASCGLHPSTAQQHLVILVNAGLAASESLAPEGRGRPKVAYSAVTPADAYRDLSQVLVEGIIDPTLAVEIGRLHGGRLEPEPQGPAETIRREAERMGFDPDMRTRPDGKTEIVLRARPIAGVAAGNERVVCSVHRGIAEGVLSADGEVTLLEFVARKPSDAGCRLVLGPRHDSPNS